MKTISNPIVNAQVNGVRLKHKDASSKYHGVTWSKRERKWVSRFIYRDSMGTVHNKRLGAFKDERDAAIAYDKVAIHFNLPTNILKKHEPSNQKDNGTTN